MTAKVECRKERIFLFFMPTSLLAKYLGENEKLEEEEVIV